MPAATAPRRVIRAAPSDDNRPIGDFLARYCPEVPVGFLNKLIRKGLVRIDGAPSDEKLRLRPGQRVEVFMPPGSFLVAPNPSVPFRILHEDQWLVVVDKPAGVVTEPGIGHKLDTLLNGLVARYGEMLDSLGPEHDYGLVHRLDRDTSGIMLVAKSADIQRKLSAQFRGRRVEKRYVALVIGRLPQDRAEIRLPLGRVRRGGRAVAVTEGPEAVRALTTYRVIERFSDATLVEASPHTGRWRQIRLHFQALGHPVAGDPDEGNPQANQALAERAVLTRMFLHAASLRFEHPVERQEMKFQLPLPEELSRVLAKLRSR